MDLRVRSLHKNFMEWAAGPTGSITLHIIAIVLLFIFASQLTKEQTSEIEVKMVEVDQKELDDLLEDLKPPEDLPEVETVTPPEVDIDMAPPPEITDFTASPMPDTPTELEIASDAISPLIIKNLAPGNMRGRTSEGQAAAIGKYGGQWGKYAEAAVLRALEWLRINQNPDGSWGHNDCEAYAGLALLTYLAHGETVNSQKYGDTVQKAIRYLVARQNDKGEFVKTEGAGGVYGHAICTYAISEAYSMTRIPSLKTSMERATQILINGQKPHGGYIMYTFGPGGDNNRWDVSLTGFCAQALKAAYIAGAENEGLKACMEKVVKFYKDKQRDDGGFPYSAANPGRQPNMTGVGVLALQLLGYATDSATTRGLSFLASADASWNNPPQAPMYSWYYVTQAKFHQGGAHWNNWNNKVMPALIRNQNEDGSWFSPGLALKGDGVTREDRGQGISTKVYATTLAALSLQVYYRFLPTYQPISTEAITHTSSDDIQIEIL
jgi:hypothetical protein